MITKIDDDFDLAKIAVSGQCFRVRKIADCCYRFIYEDKVLYIREYEKKHFSVSCGKDEWSLIWTKFFDLNRKYSAIRERAFGINDFVDNAITYGKGIRVLRQDPWEMLISFLISQRKSIPAIITAVDKICHQFGRPITTEYETVYTFPSADELLKVTEKDLQSCGLGYRTKYILDAIRKVSSKEVDLTNLESKPDQELVDCLQEIYGVGKKVANCVALFSYGRTACVPVDVWINRAINIDCAGDNPFPLYGSDAGIIQQYVFLYEKRRQ